MNFVKIIDFLKFFRSSVESIQITGRNKIITFKDIFYCCLYMNGNSSSYSLTNINMFINDIFDVTDTALKKKRNNVNFVHLKQISDSLIDFIYENDNEPRIIGVDETYVPLSIDLKDEGFKTSKRKTYCIGLISSLFDINKKLLINFNLCTKIDERQGLIDQANYLKENYVLIMDRGYFSYNLLTFLNNINVKVIFRMKKNSYLVEELIRKGQTSMITKINHKGNIIKFRILSYEIDDKIYFLGTTIMNKTVAYFKNIYWKRWRIEINFRESKYLLSLNKILSKNTNNIQQDIYSHNILFILHSYIKNEMQKNIPKDKFINSKNLMYLITSNIYIYVVI